MTRPVVTKPEAIAQGLERYYTGKPCPRGYVAERRVTNSHCVACVTEYAQEARDKLKSRIAVARDGLPVAQPGAGLGAYIPDGLKLKGTSTLTRTDAGEPLWIKTTQDAERQRELMQAAVKAMTDDLPRVSPRKATGDYLSHLLTVYPIGDPHVGMYSWHEETGEDWDLGIAERMHLDAMATLVQAAPASEQALIVNLGDLFHYDGLAPVTPRSGHNLDSDGRYAKMVAVGVKIIRRCIESALEKHAHVHVINAPGNHDETGALWLSVALSNVYENEPRVTVDTNPSVFAYYRWGKVLLGVHHGHTAKREALPGVMAADRAKDWGETEHRHWLTGHIHHESKRELAGCTVESFSTLAAKDAYATNGGWRSNRAMQSIIYHDHAGEVARSKVHAAMFAECGPNAEKARQPRTGRTAWQVAGARGKR